MNFVKQISKVYKDMKKTFIALAVSALMGAAFTASASVAEVNGSSKVDGDKVLMAKKVEKSYPGILNTVIKKKGIKVINEFAVSEQIKGYVLKEKSQTSVIYAVGDNVFSGIIFDKDGNNLSIEHNEKFIPKPSMANTVADIESRGSYAQEGAESGKPIVYIFSDPNCGYCKKLYKQTRPLVEDKSVTLRWVEVGFLQNSQAPTSRDKAAYILKAENKAQAKMQMELGFTPKGVETKDYRAVGINQEIMQAAGIKGTPTMIIYNGKQWEKAQGLTNKKLLERAKVAPAK